MRSATWRVVVEAEVFAILVLSHNMQDAIGLRAGHMYIHGTVIIVGAKPDRGNSVKDPDEADTHISSCWKGSAISVDMNTAEQRIVQGVVIDEALTETVHKIAGGGGAPTEAKNVQYNLSGFDRRA